jgi:transcriptional regulator with XRE-family HTH domain
MAYGERIKHYRVLRRLSQEDLAALTGITYTSISRIEHGTRKVTLEEAVRFVTVLGISLEDLAGLPACVAQQNEVKLLAQHCVQKVREAEAAVHAASVVAQHLDLTLSVSS